MIVRAKCVTSAFDNQTTMYYEAGQEYEIDSDGPLARMGKKVFVFDSTSEKPDGDEGVILSTKVAVPVKKK